MTVIVKVLEKPPQPTPKLPETTIQDIQQEEEKKEEVPIKVDPPKPQPVTPTEDLNQFQGEITSQSEIIEVEPGQQVQSMLTLANTGNYSWPSFLSVHQMSMQDLPVFLDG